MSQLLWLCWETKSFYLDIKKVNTLITTSKANRHPAPGCADPDGRWSKRNFKMCLREKEEDIQYMYLIQTERVSKLGGDLASKRHSCKVEYIQSKMYLRRCNPKGDRMFIASRLWGQLTFISLINCETHTGGSCRVQTTLSPCLYTTGWEAANKWLSWCLRCWPESSGATVLNMMDNISYSTLYYLNRTFIGILISFSHNSLPPQIGRGNAKTPSLDLSVLFPASGEAKLPEMMSARAYWLYTEKALEEKGQMCCLHCIQGPAGTGVTWPLEAEAF